MVIPLVDKAAPCVYWTEVTKLITEMQRQMLVWSEIYRRIELEEGGEIGVHVVFILLDRIFVQIVHRCSFDSGNQVDEVLQS